MILLPWRIFLLDIHSETEDKNWTYISERQRKEVQTADKSGYRFGRSVSSENINNILLTYLIFFSDIK